MIKKLILCTVLLTLSSGNLLADNKKKITINEMEIHLATLEKEIAEEKVKLFQKEALLQDAKLALLKEKKAQKNK